MKNTPASSTLLSKKLPAGHAAPGRCERVYLDANATTPLRCEAMRAMQHTLENSTYPPKQSFMCGNAASLHPEGRHAYHRLEEARNHLATLLGCKKNELIFTSGGTESNALAIQGTTPYVRHFLIGATEHPCVVKNAAHTNVPLTLCSVHKDGQANIKYFEKILERHALKKDIKIPNEEAFSKNYQQKHNTLDIKEKNSQKNALANTQKPEKPLPFLASFMAANHETGVMHPLNTIAALVHTAGGVLHTDTCQILGKMPFSLKHVDLATFSSHKLGGPVGVGALFVRGGTPLQPLWQGGGQEQGLRSGTPSLMLIEGFVSAVDAAIKNQEGFARQTRQWRDTMEQRIMHEAPDAVIWGQDAPRLPHVCCLAMPGVTQDTQLMHFDLAGFSLSGGAACSSTMQGSSPVLQAMHADPALADCTVRLSMGWHTTEQDIHTFTDCWLALYHRLHAQQKAPHTHKSHSTQQTHNLPETERVSYAF